MSINIKRNSKAIVFTLIAIVLIIFSFFYHKPNQADNGQVNDKSSYPGKLIAVSSEFSLQENMKEINSISSVYNQLSDKLVTNRLKFNQKIDEYMKDSLYNKNMINFIQVYSEDQETKKELFQFVVYDYYSFQTFFQPIQQIIPLSKNRYLYHINFRNKQDDKSMLLCFLKINDSKLISKSIYEESEPILSKVIDAKLFENNLIILNRRETTFFFPEIMKLDLQNNSLNKDVKDYDLRFSKSKKIRFRGVEPDYVFGGKILGKDKFIFQGDLNIDKNRFLPLNFLSITDSNMKTIEEFQSGYSIVNGNHTGVYDGTDTEYPISISPDRNRLLFLARYSGKPEKMGSIYEIQLWLSLLNLQDKTIRKILPMEVKKPAKKVTIRWNPINTDLVAISGVYGQEIEIIDINRKSRISIGRVYKHGRKIISMQWSPKGDKLGYLDNEGNIIVYNVKTNAYKIIDKNVCYFDIFWNNTM